METSTKLLELANSRGRSNGLAYLGSLLPKEAHDLLRQLPAACMVDVRTEAEVAWVGYVPDSHHIEWNSWPSGEQNRNFVAELRAAAPDTRAPVLFLCRSGARSHRAAEVAAAAGYEAAINVLEGFEGDRDADYHRGTVGGWRHAGLPWAQN